MKIRLNWSVDIYVQIQIYLKPWRIIQMKWNILRVKNYSINEVKKSSDPSHTQK